MKKIIISIVFLLSVFSYAQNTYSVQPGVKNNQIVLELSNISSKEAAQIISLPSPSKGGAYERVNITSGKEKTIDLQPGETKEIIFTFDVNYNIGNTEADTIEFLITDNKSVYQTKLFILQYSVPTEFKLEQNYPNPFNPTTKIRFTIPTLPSSSPLAKGRNEVGFVTLKVYDILGNEVTTLVNERKDPGYYEIDFNASPFASGVYIYSLQSRDYISMKKMLLLK